MNEAYLNDSLRYLRQQADIFGDEVILDSPIIFGENSAPGNDATEELNEYYESVKSCMICPLGKSRNKFVFGVGNPNADLMLIGEAPGKEEDLRGEPFVGRAGQLLDKILAAINLSRDEVYIANILKCRPPSNRDPVAEEVAACIPYLRKQIAIIKPKLILALGRVSATRLLGTTLSLGNMRGQIYKFEGIDFMVTYHPAALLRNPHWKRPCWEDVQKVKERYLELKAGERSR